MAAHDLVLTPRSTVTIDQGTNRNICHCAMAGRISACTTTAATSSYCKRLSDDRLFPLPSKGLLHRRQNARDKRSETRTPVN